LLLLVVGALCVVANRPIKIFMYQYIPDLNGDFYAGLKAKLEDTFFHDTGLNVSVTYSYDYNTYEHTTIGDALTTGDYDMVEADATAVHYLADNNFIHAIPNDVDITGFTDESLAMSRDEEGTLYMVPSYSCVNVQFSYDASLKNVDSAGELIPWINARLAGHPEKIGWAADLSSVWNLRYTYIDGYLDTYKHRPLYPDAYSATLDTGVVDTLKALRDSCVDRLSTPHSNPCMDTTYYNDYGRYFGDFVDGRSVILQGFPEYLSTILALRPGAPASITTAKIGDGDKNFVYTNGFVVSKANCAHDCMGTAIAWMNWQKVNHGMITSLGLDLSPPRPRYLLWSWKPFYDLHQVKVFPQYEKYWKMQKKGIPIEIEHILQTQNSQYNALKAQIVDGYVAP